MGLARYGFWMTFGSSICYMLAQNEGALGKPLHTAAILSYGSASGLGMALATEGAITLGKHLRRLLALLWAVVMTVFFFCVFYPERPELFRETAVWGIIFSIPASLIFLTRGRVGEDKDGVEQQAGLL